MIIRKLTAADSADFYNVRLLGLELHPEAFGTGADDFRNATDAQIKDQLNKNTQTDFTLGAFVEDRLAGLISLKREPKASVRHKATVWGFFVVPQHRQKNIGKDLLAKLISESRKIDGLDYLRAVVTINEMNSKRLFESAGFIEYGLEANGIKQNSKYYDQSFLKYKL